MKKQVSSVPFGVIGLGRFGTALVETLAKSGKEVIAVDKDEQKVERPPVVVVMGQGRAQVYRLCPGR